MRICKVVLADIGQADVIAGIQVEHVEAHSATDFESAVTTLEITIVKGAERCAVIIILNAAVSSHCHISASIGLDACLVADKVLVLDEQRNLQVVQIVGELAGASVALATLLGIVQTCLKEQRSPVGELDAGCSADIQAALETTAVELWALAVNVGSIYAQAQAEVIAVPCDIFVSVASHCLNAGIIAITVSGLRHCRQSENHTQQA